MVISAVGSGKRGQGLSHQQRQAARDEGREHHLARLGHVIGER
jgi:hypothetical protein